MLKEGRKILNRLVKKLTFKKHIKDFKLKKFCKFICKKFIKLKIKVNKIELVF